MVLNHASSLRKLLGLDLDPKHDHVPTNLKPPCLALREGVLDLSRDSERLLPRHSFIRTLRAKHVAQGLTVFDIEEIVGHLRRLTHNIAGLFQDPGMLLFEYHHHPPALPGASYS